MSFNFIPQAHAAGFTAGDQWQGAGCAQDGVATIGGIQCLIGNVLVIIPSMLVLAAVGMIIFAGIKIINAGADTKAYAAGWNTFYYAAIGLVLLSVVWFVIVLIQNYTGTNITEFGIPN